MNVDDYVNIYGEKYRELIDQVIYLLKKQEHSWEVTFNQNRRDKFIRNLINCEKERESLCDIIVK